jgi:hypothetical protein
MYARRGCRLQLHAHCANHGRFRPLVCREKVCCLQCGRHSLKLRIDNRIDVGGKLLTNHLKELVSFRQWNMMEETYIVNDVKEQCCYVSRQFAADLETCRFATFLRSSQVNLTYQPRHSGLIGAVIQSSRNMCSPTFQEIGRVTYASLTFNLLMGNRSSTWAMNAFRVRRCCSVQTT